MKSQKRLLKWFEHRWQYFVVLIFGLILSVGVWSFIHQVMTGDDYAFHVTRLQSALAGWQNGQIVPQVDPNALNGFGYAYNLFYGPLVTYIAGGLQLLLNFWPVVINLILILCLIGSGLAMCYTMTKVSKNQHLAALTAVFYMAAPYTLNNLYSRMALGEVVAFVAAPILLLGLYQLLVHDKHAARSIAVSAALLLLSHSLSAMLFAVMAAVFVLINWRKTINWDNIWRMILGVTVALGLTAFFTLPLVEAKMTNIYGVFDSGYSDVYFGANARSMNDHRLWPQQLIVTNFDAVNAEGLSGEFGVTLGIVALIGLVGFWFVRQRIEDDNERRFVTSLYIIAVLAILVALPIVNWYHLPGIFWQMQFPWRTLMISTLALAVVSGYTIYLLIRNISNERQKVAVVAIGMLAIYVVTPLIMPRAERHLDDIAKVKQDPVVVGWEAEYAPMQLLCSPDDEKDVAQGYACSLSRVRERLAERGSGLRVMSGGMAVMEATKDGLRMTLKVDNSSDMESLIELPMIYYPGYKATLDGHELNVSYSAEYGLVTVTVPAKTKGEIKVYYGMSFATQLGAMVSVVTVILGGIWLVISAVNEHRARRKESEMMKVFAEMREAVANGITEEVDLESEALIDEIHNEDQEVVELPKPAAPEAPLTSMVPPEVPEVVPEINPTKDSTSKAKTTKKPAQRKTTTKTKVVKARATRTSTKAATRRSTTTRVRTVKNKETK